jgi:hypothetical protein
VYLRSCKNTSGRMGLYPIGRDALCSTDVPDVPSIYTARPRRCTRVGRSTDHLEIRVSGLISADAYLAAVGLRVASGSITRINTMHVGNSP